MWVALFVLLGVTSDLKDPFAPPAAARVVVDLKDPFAATPPAPRPPHVCTDLKDPF